MTPRAYDAACRLAIDPGATAAERENARQRCREYERSTVRRHSVHPVEAAVQASKNVHDQILHARQRTNGMPKVPWWTLKVAPRTGPRVGRWMGNTAEFRQVLRGEKSGRCAISDHVWSNYTGNAETLSILDSGRVDWAYFPDTERMSQRWRPSAEMRRAAQLWATEQKTLEILRKVGERNQIPF